MQRGEVWWVAFRPPIGPRPAVLLTRNSAYSARTHVTVAPITRSIRDIASYVTVGGAEGLRQESAVNLDDIQTVPTSWLDRLVSTLSPAKMEEVDAAIKFALALR